MIGKSAGFSKGNRNALKHGRYTAAALGRRRRGDRIDPRDAGPLESSRRKVMLPIQHAVQLSAHLCRSLFHCLVLGRDRPAGKPGP